MKRAFTLIEILLSLVVLSIVFVTIPKILFSMNENMKFAKRKEAFYIPFSLIRYISFLPWDENNTENGEVLITGSLNQNFECNSSLDYLRKGSFSKERSCKNLLKASLLGKDAGDESFDDIDDYKGRKIAFLKNRTRYEMRIDINYLKDDGSVFVYDYDKGEVFIDLSKASKVSHSSNLKEIKIILSKKETNGGDLLSLSYISSNIGEILIDGEEW